MKIPHRNGVGFFFIHPACSPKPPPLHLTHHQGKPTAPIIKKNLKPAANSKILCNFGV